MQNATVGEKKMNERTTAESKILTNEQKATIIGNSRRMLRAELMLARSMLTPSFRKMFDRFTFDFDRKCLVGCSARLQWRVRLNPDLPESYNNQQLNCGTIVVEREDTAE